MRTKSNRVFSDDEEPIGEAFLKPWAWLGALAVLAVIAVAQRHDAVEDHHAEWAKSQALEDAQAAEARAQRVARAAQEMCSSEHGPQALAVWVSADTVECVSPRGRRLSHSSGLAEVSHAR